MVRPRRPAWPRQECPLILGNRNPGSRMETLMAQATTDSPRTSVRHPLAPLTAGEAGQAGRLALAAAAPATRLVYCALAEPAKRAVLAWDGRPLPREARCVLYERPAGQTWMVTVALDNARGGQEGPGARTSSRRSWPRSGSANAEQIKADPGFRAALARRGITDMSLVQVDPWPASNFGLEVDASGRRLARGVAYVLDGPGSNPYARPVENLVAVAGPRHRRGDRARGRRGGAHPRGPRPVRRGQRRRTARAGAAADPAAGRARLHRGRRAACAGGPGRCGCRCTRSRAWCCTRSATSTAGAPRPVLYRASLAEMVVPYGSTALNHWWKNAFDAGDVGLGKMADLARPRLRLPGRDRLPGRGHHGGGRHRERPAAGHLPARGGLRDPLEARRRRRTRPPRCAGPGGWWSRPSPPSATTSTASSGTSTWTARSRPRSS